MPNPNSPGFLPNQPIQSGPPGPLGPLEAVTYDFTALSYPLDLGTNPQRGHAINFYIDVQNGSNYIDQFTKIPGQTSTAATNLANDQTQQQLLPSIIQQGASSQGLGLSGGTSRVSTAISLYMPDTVNFVYNTGYDTPSLTDALGDFGFIASTLGSKEVYDDLQSLLNNGSIPKAANLFKALGGQAVEAGNKALGGSDSTLGILGAAVGIAVNPQLQVIFKGVDLRSFQFEFRFAPTSSTEAAAVQNIIKTFRFHQAPEIAINSGAGRYFIPPSQFDIQFLFSGQVNRNIPSISTCVLTNLNVDYGASGNWATFSDGMPIDIRLILQFTEIEIITKTRVTQGY